MNKWNPIEILKTQWRIKTNKDLYIVLLIFSINGTLTAIISKPIFKHIGFHSATFNIGINSIDNLNIIYYIMYFVMMTILWAVLLVMLSYTFGYYKKFFAEFLKKFSGHFGLGFIFKSKTEKEEREKNN